MKECLKMVASHQLYSRYRTRHMWDSCAYTVPLSHVVLKGIDISKEYVVLFPNTGSFVTDQLRYKMSIMNNTLFI